MRKWDRVTYPREVARESSPPILARSFMPLAKHAGRFLEANSGGMFHAAIQKIVGIDLKRLILRLPRPNFRESLNLVNSPPLRNGRKV